MPNIGTEFQGEAVGEFRAIIWVMVVALILAFAIDWAARRFASFPKTRGVPFYLLSLPVACGLLGIDVAVRYVAITNVLGIADILWAISRSKRVVKIK